MIPVEALEADMQDAALRLAAISAPGRWKALGAEAHRRAAVIAAAVNETTFGLGNMTPLAAGYRSVADDVKAGRLA